MNSFFKTFTRFAGCTSAFVILAAIFSSGCRSTDKPESAGFAAVVISNQSVDRIKQAAMTVFQQNGYQPVTLPDGTLVFEREATEREQRQYAGFAGAHEGEKVVMRVRMNIAVKNPAAYWVSCKAYAVCNPGQGVFENITPLFNFQSGPYQKLMDQIARQVVMSTPAP